MLVEKFAVSAVTTVGSAGLEDLTLPDNWRPHNYGTAQLQGNEYT